MTHVIRRLSLCLACVALLCAGGLPLNFAQNNNAAPKRPRIGVVGEYTIRLHPLSVLLEFA